MRDMRTGTSADKKGREQTERIESRRYSASTISAREAFNR